MYIWWTLFTGQRDDVKKWTRKRAIFAVARQLLGLKQLLNDKKFMKLPTAQACIDEAQNGLEYMCEVQRITKMDIQIMTNRILRNYPL